MCILLLWIYKAINITKFCKFIYNYQISIYGKTWFCNFCQSYDLDPWLLEDDRRRRSSDDVAYSGYNGYNNPDLIFAESSEYYNHLKNRDNKTRIFCQTELHDCGQPTELQEEKCVDEQFNHCICPIARSYRIVSGFCVRHQILTQCSTRPSFSSLRFWYHSVSSFIATRASSIKYVQFQSQSIHLAFRPLNPPITAKSVTWRYWWWRWWRHS